MLKNKKGKPTTYVGWTNNIEKRLNRHNLGKGAKYTRGREWKLIYYEIFNSKKKAMKREFHIKKNRKLRMKIKEMN